MMIENLNKLKNDIFYQAKTYLEGIGEFAPFGVTLSNDVITPLGYYSEEEIVDSANGVDMLKGDITKKIQDNIIEIGAIAFDVAANFKNADGISKKRDALCLIISSDGQNWSEEYFPYMIIDGECVWR